MIGKKIWVFENNKWIHRDMAFSIDIANQLNGDHYVMLPAFFDTHIHGTGGHDFSEGTTEAYGHITQALAEAGVGYCLATYFSMSLDTLKSSLKNLEKYQNSEHKGHTKILGVHLEGPYISKQCKGAHDEAVIRNQISLEEFKSIIECAPSIDYWKITLDPAVDGAIEFIKAVQNLEVNGGSVKVDVYLGHTNAETTVLNQALEAGAKGFTHLGNACGETCQRTQDKVINDTKVKSNLVSAAFEAPGTILSELIIDFHHVSQAFIKLCLMHYLSIVPISDALSASGQPDGTYDLSSLKVAKRGETITIEGTDTLAGSATLLPTMLINFLALLNAHLKETKIRQFSNKHTLPHEWSWQKIYEMFVTNTRDGHPSEKFSDKDYVILDATTGKLIFSTCDEYLYEHAITKDTQDASVSKKGMFADDKMEPAVSRRHPGVAQ